MLLVFPNLRQGRSLILLIISRLSSEGVTLRTRSRFGTSLTIFLSRSKFFFVVLAGTFNMIFFSSRGCSTLCIRRRGKAAARGNTTVFLLFFCFLQIEKERSFFHGKCCSLIKAFKLWFLSSMTLSGSGVMFTNVASSTLLYTGSSCILDNKLSIIIFIDILLKTSFI